MDLNDEGGQFWVVRARREGQCPRTRESSHLLPPSFFSWLSETSSMKVFDTITGIIYLVIAAIELGGFLAALKVSFVFLRPLCLSRSRQSSDQVLITFSSHLPSPLSSNRTPLDSSESTPSPPLDPSSSLQLALSSRSFVTLLSKRPSKASV